MVPGTINGTASVFRLTNRGRSEEAFANRASSMRPGPLGETVTSTKVEERVSGGSRNLLWIVSEGETPFQVKQGSGQNERPAQFLLSVHITDPQKTIFLQSPRVDQISQEVEERKRRLRGTHVSKRVAEGWPGAPPPSRLRPPRQPCLRRSA